MAETDEQKDAAPRKSGKLGLLIGGALMLVGGGGGFYAVQSGLLLGGADETAAAQGEAGAPGGSGAHGEGEAFAGAAEEGTSDVAFLPVEPLLVSLAGPAQGRHLRFRAELEVPQAHVDAVEHLMPRIVDVMNGYLRAVDPADLESPGGLTALRAQMLRRVELVAGHGRVSDVLVMEFVLS